MSAVSSFRRHIGSADKPKAAQSEIGVCTSCFIVELNFCH